jgi:hypothetical protein
LYVLTIPTFLPVVLLAAACSSAPEQQLLQKYFQASRLRDNTTLANIATVSFSPNEQGAVTGFDIVSSEPEQRRPLGIKELAAAEEAARSADEDFNKRKKEYQDSNLVAIERVLKAERANASVRGADAGIQKAWRQWRDDTSMHARKLADARQALTEVRMLAEASTYDPRTPVDVTKFDGEVITKDLVLRADVRAPSGEVQTKDLHVRLTRVELTNGPEGRNVSGRWIITHIGESPAGAAATN